MAFLNSVPDSVAEKAAAIQARYNAKIAAIASNGDLRPEARQKRLAEAWVDASAEMVELRGGFEGGEAKTADNLTVDLFGSVSSVGADAISARDADDRVSQLKTPDEAEQLLRRAESNGDQVLARSIALRAYEEAEHPLGRSWAPVLDAYAERRPEVASKMAELAEARRTSLEKSIGRAFIFVVNKPHELQHLHDHQIKALAAKELPPEPRSLRREQSPMSQGWGAYNPYEWLAPR